MKHFILISLAVLMFIITTPRAHALFGHVAAEKERRHEAEQRVVQAQQTNGRLIETNGQLTRIGAWMLIPAIFVMPVVGLILWQVMSWLSMLTNIFGHLIVLPLLVLLVVFVIRIFVAFIRR